MNARILGRAMVAALALTVAAVPTHAHANTYHQVATFAQYKQALEDCADLAAGTLCTISITDSFAVPFGNQGFYNGSANLSLVGNTGVVITGATSSRMLVMDATSTNATLLVTRLRFEGFSQQLYQGAAFLLDGVHPARFENVVFVGNSAQAGGAIAARDDTTLVIQEGMFDANVDAQYGGAIFLDRSYLVATRSVFQNNDAASSGGAVYAQNGSDVTITHSILSGNGHSSNNGTAQVINLHQSDLHLTHVTISDVLPGVGHTAIGMPASGYDATVSASVMSPGATLASCGSTQTLLVSEGHNWIPAGGCEQTHASDVVGKDPLLLRPVPGKGWVIPASASGLRDAYSTDCGFGDLQKDVRSVVRPQGPGCDVGAFELTAPEFSDVPLTHPFVAEVMWLEASGVTGGYADDTFRPLGAVSRQAMAAFLYRLAGSPEYVAPASPSFPDVPLTHPFFSEIEWLVAQEVTTGYGDGTFRPGAGVSRQAMAAFLYRFAGAEEDGPQQASFSDVATSHAFFAEVEWLAQVGVTTGYTDGTFRPGATVSRQAMAAFLARFPVS